MMTNDEARRKARRRTMEERIVEAGRADGHEEDRRAYIAVIERLSAEDRLTVFGWYGDYAEGTFLRVEDTTLTDSIPSDRIRLYRRTSSTQIDDLQKELHTLVHEAGHARSCRDDGWHPNYVAWREAIHARRSAAAPGASEPLPPRVSAEAGHTYREEELKAWRYGRELLERVSYQRLDLYDQYADRQMRDVVDVIVGEHAEES